MKIANVRERLSLIVDGKAVDVADASGGRFGPSPQSAFDDWAGLREWAATVPSGAGKPFAESDLRCPAPAPRQVFGIGLNYRAHAKESSLPIPDRIATFTKFPSCLAGPFDDVELPSPFVDWEVELVVVIGARAHRVGAADAWKHVAGLAVGQDISERVVQWGGGGQFSLGKSFPGFGPFGPWITTPEEVADCNDLALACKVGGDTVQSSRTSDMVFSVGEIVEQLSAILPLMPGDLIFTGTPEGVGAARKPPRFLQAGEVLESTIEGLGTIRNRMVAAK